MPVMTMKELKDFFKEHRVPSSLYKLGGNHNHRICIEQCDGEWEVFFSEKKQKTGLMRFDSEESACSRMKDEIRKLMELMYGLTWA